MPIVKSQEIKGKLTHWSDKDMTKHLLVNNSIPPVRAYNLKPNGIWLSWNNGWEDWCESESDFISDRDLLKCKLKKDLKILLIDGSGDFRKWMDSVGIEGARNDIHFRYMFFEPNLLSSVWKETYKTCDGIALTDKGQCETRMGTFMYGWDCASLCIFDMKNIEFKKVKKWHK